VIINPTGTLRALQAAALLARLAPTASARARVALHAAPMPGTPGATSGIGAVQVTLPLLDAVGAVSGTAVELAVPLEGQRAAGLPITWARLIDAGGTVLLDLDVTLAGQGGAVQLDAVEGYTGAYVRLTRLALAY
jgi:hypothetical protein